MRRAQVITDDGRVATNSQAGLNTSEFIHRFLENKPRGVLEIIFSSGRIQKFISDGKEVRTHPLCYFK